LAALVDEMDDSLSATDKSQGATDHAEATNWPKSVDRGAL
jgi:hypothetical protein